MARILGISGSLRSGSLNSALLHAAARLMPEGAQLEIGTIRGIPLYDGDVEAQAGPVSRAGQVFESGELKDEKIKMQLRDFLRGFVEFAGR